MMSAHWTERKFLTQYTKSVTPFCNIPQKEGANMAKKPKHEESNPQLRASFLEVVDNQLKANDPPETRQTLDRLIAQGIF